MTKTDQDSPSDVQLIKAVSNGDQQALGTLYDRHSQQMLGVAFAVLGSWRTAEDLLHDVFMEIWISAPAYRPGDSSVIYWLLKLVRHRAVMRRRALNQHTNYQQRAGRVRRPATPTVDTEIDSEKAIECLLRLPAAQRDVVLLSYLQGYSYQQIAELFGEPVAAIKARTTKALSQLRLQLRAAGD